MEGKRKQIVRVEGGQEGSRDVEKEVRGDVDYTYTSNR
jgi:hypothetical protein